jgi:hypothetical protein
MNYDHEEKGSPSGGTPAASPVEGEFRRDAKIWSLYLKGAREEAKERAELWQTGLESVLLFVGCKIQVSEMTSTYSIGRSVCRSCGLLHRRHKA